MNEELQSVLRERIKHAGGATLIEVLPCDEGFQGQWTCAMCVQGGASAGRYATAEAASSWAKMAANVHYAVVHTDM